MSDRHPLLLDKIMRQTLEWQQDPVARVAREARREVGK
jgi:hypothetical protein